MKTKLIRITMLSNTWDSEIDALPTNGLVTK